MITIKMCEGGRGWVRRAGYSLPLLLLLLFPFPTTSSRLRNNLPTYLSDYLHGLSLDPQPVLYDTIHTTDTTTTTQPPTPPTPQLPPLLPPSSEPPVVTVSRSSQSDRLPDTVRPLHYTVRVRPLIHGDQTMNGSVDIYLEVTRPTANITIHVAKMFILVKDIELVSGPGDTGGPIPRITHYTTDPDLNMFTAHLTREVRAGRKLRYFIPYVATISNWGEGFFVVSYDDDGVKRKLLTSMHQPSSARQAFPCLDEPHLKASFMLQVARDTNMTAISNMPLVNTTPMKSEPGWVIDSFQKTPPMSTYNLMLVVSSFDHVEVNNKPGLPIRVWGRPGVLNETAVLQEVVVDLLNYMEEYTGIPFPLPKLDLALIPADTGAAFEGWGLIQYYSDKDQTYLPGRDDDHKRNKIALLTAHELAHQWFGNLVTPRWWSHIWLSEGFATYYQYLAGMHVLPGERFVREGPIRMLHMILDVDSRPFSHPVQLPEAQKMIEYQIFDSIEYHKSAALIQMMNHFLTPNTFTKGIRSYLKAHQYGSAGQDDLWVQLTQAGHGDGTLATHLNVSTIMNTWTTKTGYPVVKVVRAPSGTSATLYQERFIVVVGNRTHDRHANKWWIPLTFTTQAAPNFTDTRVKLWMQDTENQMTLRPLPSKDQWVIFNLQSTGFYRVNYDDNNWRLLTQQLLTNHTVIHVINRAQLIDDALELALAGELDYKVALNVSSYLAQEEDELPWRAFIKNAERVEEMLKKSPAFGALKKYILSLMVPMYSKFGSVSENILEVQTKHSELVKLACSLDHPDCVHLATSLYSQWMNNQGNITAIPLVLREAVFCTAIAHGGEAEWDFAWRQYMLTTDHQYKYQLLKAMGCRREHAAKAGTSETIGGFRNDVSVGTEDGTETGTEGGTETKQHFENHDAWDTITSRWHHLSHMLGEDKIGVEKLVMAATQSFNTRLDIQKLKMFRDAHRDDPSVVRASDSALRRVAHNMAWRERYSSVVSEWLQEEGFSVQGDMAGH